MVDLSTVVGRATESLRGLLLIEMPDAKHYDSWQADDFDVDTVASYFGDLVRAQHRALKELNSQGGKIGTTIETGNFTVIIRTLNERIAGVFLFDQSTRLGIARYELNKLIKALLPDLPTEKVVQRNRGVRVIEFLSRYAPDPHAILMRISLRTGIDLTALQNPDTLNPDEVQDIEHAGKEILGLETLSI